MISVEYYLKILSEKAQTEKLTPNERYWYNITKQNYDSRQKETGDKIIIWDSSLMVDYNTDDYINCAELISKINNNIGIVVSNDQKYEVVTNMIENIDNMDRLFLDLIVYIPKLGLKVRTHSDFVRLT